MSTETIETATATDAVRFNDLKGEARYEAVRSEIDAAIARLATPEQWEHFLAAYSGFHQYSLSNTLLAMIQYPSATMLASYRKWEEKGRQVVKGSKAIYVFAPMTRKVAKTDKETGEESTGRQVTGFKLVPVFDVSQTEGEPLPESPVTYVPVEGDAPEGVIEALTAKIEAAGYRIVYRELDGATQGRTTYSGQLVEIDPTYSGAEQVRTLAHELAHIALGHEHRRESAQSDREVEAESVAYVLARHYGIPTEDSAFAYIANWASGDLDKVKATATVVTKTARALLEGQDEAA
jgi:hypothetical protein